MIFRKLIGLLGLGLLGLVGPAFAQLSHYDRLIVASCLTLEAAEDGERGMYAVLNVINNRAQGDLTRVVPVVVKPHQFAAMNGATLQRNPDYGPLIERATLDPNFQIAFQLVRQLEAGELEDITEGADHFFSGEPPIWASYMTITVRIGGHTFLRSHRASEQYLAMLE